MVIPLAQSLPQRIHKQIPKKFALTTAFNDAQSDLNIHCVSLKKRGSKLMPIAL